MVSKYTFDKNGNLKKAVYYANIDGETKQNIKITYKKGKISKAVTKIKYPWISEPAVMKMVFKYKKIKVNKADKKQIKKQQWKLSNPVAVSFAWFDF